MDGINVNLLPSGATMCDRMVAALARNDCQAHDVVAAICSRLGRPAHEWLVTVAISQGLDVQHRVNVLEMLKRLGQPLDFDESFRLARLTRSPSAAIREKVIEVFDVLAGSPMHAAHYALPLAAPKRSRTKGPDPAFRRTCAEIVKYAERKAKGNGCATTSPSTARGTVEMNG